MVLILIYKLIRIMDCRKNFQWLTKKNFKQIKNIKLKCVVYIQGLRKIDDAKLPVISNMNFSWHFCIWISQLDSRSFSWKWILDWLRLSISKVGIAILWVPWMWRGSFVSWSRRVVLHPLIFTIAMRGWPFGLCG